MTSVGKNKEKSDAEKGKRLELRREARKQAILRAAGSELERVGYSRANLDDVADRVHVTKATLYHYFANKEELFQAWMEHVSDAAEERLSAATGDPDQPARQRLWNLVFAEMLILTEEFPDYAHLFMVVLDWPDSFAERLRRTRERHEAHFVKVIAEGIESGEFDVVDKSVARYCMLGGIAYVPTWFRSDGRFSSRELAAVVADTTIRLFRSPA